MKDREREVKGRGIERERESERGGIEEEDTEKENISPLIPRKIPERRNKA